MFAHTIAEAQRTAWLLPTINSDAALRVVIIYIFMCFEELVFLLC